MCSILRCWDLRVQTTSKRTRVAKHKIPTCIYSSAIDPTTLRGSRRPRGIISLTSGSGPTAGLLFGLGADSRIHTYAFPSLSPQPSEFADQSLQASSFYVGIAVSPCGKWLASGSAGKEGKGFLFDVSNAYRPSHAREGAGVGFKGQVGEVGAVDWAQGMLATCADDGTVRVWRPDVEVYNHCVEKPEESKWDWSWST
jgi:denticleless